MAIAASGLDATQFRELIIRPTLQAIGLWSQSAENLLLITAIVESRLKYIKQLGQGPALSIFQIEPKTYSYIVARLHLPKNSVLLIRILEYLNFKILTGERADLLLGNLPLAVIIARLKYYFDPSPLPPANDSTKLARYYKRIYNTPLGAATEEGFINAYNEFI